MLLHRGRAPVPARSAPHSINSSRIFPHFMTAPYFLQLLYMNSFNVSRSVSYARNNNDFVADSLKFSTAAICL